MSGPNNDWLEFYNQNFATQGITQTQSIPTSTTAATGSISPHPPRIMTSPSSSSQHLSSEGRVSKPVRRRSRASRRTPTTLLNTDTTNFRAIVQQFTGGPSALPFAPTASPASGLPNLLGFGGFGSRVVNPSTVMGSPPSAYNLLQQQQHLFRPQNQPNIYGGGRDNTFFQSVSSPTRPLHDHDVIFTDHGHGGHFFPSTSSS